MNRPVLLDTNAIIDLATGLGLSPASMDVAVEASARGALLVSPVSAWEIGNISRPRHTRRASDCLPDPPSWFRRFVDTYHVVLTPLTPEIGIAAAYLPDGINADPADRLLTATARALDAVMITRDRDILAYSAQGHVRAIAA
jgi:PIN domain nuclease of toxin-antitoxin system